MNILILSNNPSDCPILTKICRKIASVHTVTELSNALSLIKSQPIHTLIIDQSMADYTQFHKFIDPTTSIIIIGRNPKQIEERAKEWPLNQFVAFLPTPITPVGISGFQRAVHLAVQHAFMKKMLEEDQLSSSHKEESISKAFSKIKDIKRFVEKNVLTELEKHIALQTKYIRFREEKNKIEIMLKKLYKASDVTSLLDILHDVRDIIGSESISMYLIEKNATQIPYLKPLVWNNTAFSPPDHSKHHINLNAQDLTAIVSKKGRGIHTSIDTIDRTFITRHINLLDFNLKSILCLPLKHNNRVIGVIEVYNKITDDTFSAKDFMPDDQHLMRLLAEHIAIAITNLNLIQFDALTGLFRPNPFFEGIIKKLRLEKKRRQEDSAYALVMGDVDWFKKYNDRNGHEEGNELLRELSNVLKSSIREEDLLCRYGGEEFLFCLTKIEDIKEACQLTERIRKNVEEHYFKHQEFQPGKNLTMSFGVTVFSRDNLGPFDSITAEKLKKIIIEADMALLEAKEKKSASFDSTEEKMTTISKNMVCAYHSDKFQDTGLITSYKEKIAREQRKHKRYFTSAMLILQNTHGPEITRTINLSLGGAKIPTDVPLKLFHNMDLILVLGDKACHMKGNAVYSSQVEGKETNYHTGLKFSDVSMKDKVKIEEYFSSLS